ncbi:MAG: DUF3226 domain-containing protein [Cyanobacteriota bacterium]|nr:DUF3226 domain-containing protein [Cyanobacteriota bacterium]
MTKTWHGKRLLVEGDEDKRVIPYLIEANGIPWGETKEEAIVDIKAYHGIEKLLNTYKISAELGTSGLTALGLIVDADDNPTARWQQVRNVCLPRISNLPENLPEEGLIHQTNFGVKFGVWMMPDNKMSGMLETFLAYMIPSGGDRLWDYAADVIIEAKNRGATLKENHKDKAKIHSWLSWQDPPGRQLHNAIMERILDPKHPKAEIFINWFKTLYDL